ncbi:PQQ-binding-like beta-propeller repeat protein [Streptomyces sp. NPDC001744]|uniref:protein kinase domain-containing protein n=1 Tax=Streptomyces sp. NPDC001744 TaxID=3364606 RepID=UPI0036A6F879
MTPLEPLRPTDPARIGPYVLLGLLGAGGMGAVYLGRSAGGRTVAVKLIRPELADEAFRARFRAEVAAARAASGAFTAPLVDADPDGPVPWMATAYVPGVSLGRAVAVGGPLPEAALRALAAGIAESLETIHSAGLTHRDLKPGNVLLALDGPHLIDFGIARAADGTALTATGMILGTPAYMSPEQAVAAPVGPASDVFSLGSTLAFAARGTGLFDGGTPTDVLRRVVHEEPDLSAVPEGLRLLVAACLAKRPEDRPTPRQIVGIAERGAAPRTAGAWLPPALIAAIEEAAAVLAPSVTPTPPPPAREPDPAPGPPPFPPGPPVPPPFAPGASAPPAPAGPGRRRLLLGLAGGAAALAGGGTGLGLWLGGREEDGRPGGDAKPATGTTTAGPALTDPKRPLDTETTAEPLWTAPVSEPLVQVLGDGGTVVALSAKNVWAFDAGGRKKWGPVPHLPDAATGAYGGGLVATVGGGMVYAVMRRGAGELDRALRALRLDTGAEAWTLPLPYRRPNGAAVIGMLDGRVYVTGTAATTGTDPKNAFTIVSGPFVWSLDPATRKGWQAILTDPEVKYPRGSLFVPSSGTRLFWASSQTDGSAQKIAALDVRTRKLVWEQPSPGAESASGVHETLTQGRYGPWQDGPHASADGLFLHVSDRLHAVDPANGHVVWSSPEVPLKAVVASPDGKTVFAAALDGLVIRMYALVARTGAVRWTGTLLNSPGGGLPVLQSADGTVYVASGGRLWALDARDGRARWTYRLSTSLTTGVLRGFWAGGGKVYAMGQKGLVALGAAGR